METPKTAMAAQLFAMFPDQDSARTYLESRLWPNGVKCPICGMGDRIGNHSPGLYRCHRCDEAFGVRTGTVMERSHVPLNLWLRAMIVRAVDGAWPTSPALAAVTGLSQPTAWKLLRRLRETGT